MEGGQRVAVGDIEFVDDAVADRGRSIEVALGVCDDRGPGAVFGGAAEGVEGRERVVVRSIELEDGACNAICACGRSVEVARGIGDECGVGV
jgi:hypothetical protein